jgi:hypothetical protein
MDSAGFNKLPEIEQLPPLGLTSWACPELIKPHCHPYFLGGSMERSMMFPKGEKAPRRRVGVMSSPYT